MPTIDGIVSGIDTTSLISAILDSSYKQVKNLQTQKTDLTAALEGVSGLSNRLQSVADAIAEFDTSATYASYTASVPSEDQFSVTTTGQSTPGVYDVQVLAMASNEVEVSQGYADSTSSVLGAGTFSVNYGGTVTDITIDGTNDSLGGLASELNKIAGVSAFVVDTGEPSNPFKLVVQGDDTGAANTLTLDGSGLVGGTGPTFTEKRGATDAHITLNNVDVFASTNQLTGTVPGLSLTLKATGTSANTVTVAQDGTALADKLDKFVTAYNDVKSYYAVKSVYNPTANISGPLVGDSTARRVMQGMGDMVSDDYASGTNIRALSQIGIATQQDGTLEFDRDAFATALAANPDEVEALFTSATGPMATIRARIEDVYVNSSSGTLQSRKDSIQGASEALDAQITRYQDSITSQTASWRTRFTAMEVALASMQSTGSYLTAVFAQSTTSGN